MDKKCLCCFQSFVPNPKKISNQKYCHPKCNRYYNNRIRNGLNPYYTDLKKSKCFSCEKEFLHDNLTTYKYCSDICRQNLFNKNKKTPVMSAEIECQLCKIKFKVKNNLTAKYCSDKCRSLARYRKMTGYPVNGPRQRSKNGEGYINKYGYKVIYKDHPNANARTKIILEHIFVMSEHLGRPMKKGETVHHINGIRSDNRIENLELWTSRHPAGIRMQDKIKSAIDFLIEQGYKVIKE